MGKQIPGNPTIVVENMTGAGSLIAANYTFNSAKPDGLFVGTWNGALVLRQALGDNAVRLDGRKLGWIGSPTKGTPVCGIMAHTGLKTLDDVVASNREIKMGATGPGSTYEDLPMNVEPDSRNQVQGDLRIRGHRHDPCRHAQEGSGRWLLDLGIHENDRQTDARSQRR
jgi:hypothetical protein